MYFKLKIVPVGSLLVSLLPFQLNMTGLISRDDTQICFYGLDRLNPSKCLHQLVRASCVRWYRSKSFNSLSYIRSFLEW